MTDAQISHSKAPPRAYRKRKVDPVGLGKDSAFWAFLLDPQTRKFVKEIENGNTDLSSVDLIKFRDNLKMIISNIEEDGSRSRLS